MRAMLALESLAKDAICASHTLTERERPWNLKHAAALSGVSTRILSANESYQKFLDDLFLLLYFCYFLVVVVVVYLISICPFLSCALCCELLSFVLFFLFLFYFICLHVCECYIFRLFVTCLGLRVDNVGF